MSADAESQRPFKVIIAGGSVAGLTLANALERANIDFELLEKREVAPNVGQTILIMPCTVLVHEQMGMAKSTQDVGIPLKVREHWNDQGKLFCSSDELIRLHKTQQRPMYFIDRHIYIRNIYDGLSKESKLKVRAHEGIESVTESENGVTVRTDKGNLVEGSILVGADGVHSRVRQLTAQMIKETNPKSSQIISKGFKTRYRILTCTSHNHFADDPTRPFLQDGMLNNTYYPQHGIGGFSVAGVKGRIFWAIYIANDEETQYPSPRYGQADIEEAMRKWGHLQQTPNYTFNDLHKTLIGATMVPMEEGVLPTKWNNGGRVVMIGDSVHKATANLGMGGNLCVDDVCCLTNGLHALLERTKEPSTEELVKVFDDYEKAERPRADFVRNASQVFAGYETMSKWYSALVQTIFPWIPSALKMKVFSGFDGSAPVLKFLPLPASSVTALKE